MRVPFLIALLCGLSAMANAEFADYRFIPPAKAAPNMKAATALAAETLAAMKQNVFPQYQIDDYAGKTASLKQTSTNPALQVGVGANLGWTGEALFDNAARKGSYSIWRAAIGSVDATALRLNVNLSGLAPGEEVWVVDTAGDFAFGPYTFADAVDGGNWLPTTMGDSAVLVVKSTGSSMPSVTIGKLSHFYEEVFTKGTDCPLSADCLSDAALQEITTGIGRMTVTDENGTSFLCSGALLNNALTDDLESLFLTADHCFRGTAATIQATSIEVIWDLRTNGCSGSEPSNGEIAALPRSSGTAFIANSTGIDAMLMALGTVPAGSRGRAYLGWDTVAPRVGFGAVGIHHPAGTAMKASLGRIDDVGVDSSFGLSQTTISWTDGITEGGSSGSPVMFDDGNFRVFGMLSNGNVQSCNNNNARLDQYSSFQSFFSAISGSLNSDTPSLAGQAVYARTGDGPDGGIGSCFAAKARPAKDAAGDAALAGTSMIVFLALGAAQRRRRAQKR